ncbi:MAG: arginine deiminase [Actinobacteria bacterium]|nr:arginine deiminase [Actinomycetota bacterium]
MTVLPRTLDAPLLTSEIAPLREVIVHRPGLELDRLTPSNASGLLFDDVLWAARAREEHDAFVDLLRGRGIVVHHFADLLAGALDAPSGRTFALERVVTEERFGSMAGEVRRLFDDTDARGLADYLIGGITKSDLAPLDSRGLAWRALDIDDFVLPPLPNTLFQRDNAAWIGTGVTVDPMAKPARRRESLNTRTVLHHHPRFGEIDFPIYYGDDDLDHAPASFEGGDIHVLDDGVVMIGMGERTTPTGVEALVRRLYEQGQARVVLAVELPKARSAMHLDTLLTMVDRATFVGYPNLDLDRLRSWVLTRADDGLGLHASERSGLLAGIAEVLGVDAVRLLRADEDARAAEREQWNDADNYLTVAPGVVVGYDRNVVTNAMLRAHGIEVLEIPGSELGRGRGGARCMSCPVRRDPLDEGVSA